MSQDKAFAAIGAGPSGDVYHQEGMSLRDYFAAHADIKDYRFSSADEAAAFLGEETPDQTDYKATLEFAFRLASRFRYMAADAMMAERERGS